MAELQQELQKIFCSGEEAEGAAHIKKYDHADKIIIYFELPFLTLYEIYPFVDLFPSNPGNAATSHGLAGGVCSKYFHWRSEPQSLLSLMLIAHLKKMDQYLNVITHLKIEIKIYSNSYIF